MLEQKFLKFIDESEQQRDKLKTCQQGLEGTLELKVQDFIGQGKQSLEDNLLKLVSQNKIDTTISELQHKEKFKS